MYSQVGQEPSNLRELVVCRLHVPPRSDLCRKVTRGQPRMTYCLVIACILNLTIFSTSDIQYPAGFRDHGQ